MGWLRSFSAALGILIVGCAESPPPPAFPRMDAAELARPDSARAAREARNREEQAKVEAQEKREREEENRTRSEAARALEAEHVAALEVTRRRAEKAVASRARASETWDAFDALSARRRTIVALDGALSDSDAGSGDLNDDDAEALRAANQIEYRRRRVAMVSATATLAADAATVVPAQKLAECERIGARWAADEKTCTTLDGIGVAQISCPRFTGRPRMWEVREQLAGFSARRAAVEAKKAEAAEKLAEISKRANAAAAGVITTVADEGAGDDSARSASAGGPVRVRGYTRKNGTYVAPHTRRAPRR